MFDLIVRGGTVVNSGGARRADIAISGGRIAALVAPGEDAAAQLEISALGCMILPGLIDAHAHLREPGLTHKEDFLSGTSAAAAGGVTTVLDMPTDEPWTSTAQELREKMRMASGRVYTDVGFQVAMPRDLAGLQEIRALEPVSFELFTADVPKRFLHDSLDDIVTAMRALAPLDTLIGVSPGDQSILAGEAGRHAGVGDIEAFLASRPPLAEAAGIARAVLAAAETGARVHVRQTNSALGIATWRQLRDMADATIETTPQCLLFSKDDYATHGADLKASPPMREQLDVEALRAAVRSGVIDIVATDHAPHSRAEKAAAYASFSDIPGGMPGLQTLLASMLHLVDVGDIRLQDVARLCSANPAQRFGLGRRKGALRAGLDADLIVLDPRLKTTIRNGDQLSRAAYTPFDGLEVPWRISRVLLRGREIYGAAGLVEARTGSLVQGHFDRNFSNPTSRR